MIFKDSHSLGDEVHGFQRGSWFSLQEKICETA